MRSLVFLVPILVAGLSANLATADGATFVPFEGDFEDATFAVESAILDRGLNIEYVSHVGEMLARTGADVGSDKEIFVAADIFVFCSAVVSREVMEADPMNIAYCPYNIFVAETAAGVVVGHREYPDGVMQKVAAMLDEIIAEAMTD